MEEEFFSLDFGRDGDEFYIAVFEVDELVSEYRGESMANCLKHALHDQYPLLFAEIFSDGYFEWGKQHRTVKTDE